MPNASPAQPPHTRHRTRHWPLWPAALLALGLLASPAQAKRSPGQAPAHAKAPAKKGVSKITYQRSPSEESPAQRDKRLKRECKGMHNAGACQGYTR